MSNVSWYCVLNGKQAGPFSAEMLASMIRSGQVQAQDYVWREGMQQWQAAISVEEFRTLFSAAPAPAPAPTPAPAPGIVTPPLSYYGQPPYAGFWLRFVAMIIDGILLSACGCIMGGCIGGAFGAAGGMRGGSSGSGLNIAAQVVIQLGGIIIGWLYFALMESGPWQATLGKKALGLVVTDLAGNRITFGRATGRHFAKWISSIILLIGYMMAGWTEKKQALHDKIADTLVVKRQG